MCTEENSFDKDEATTVYTSYTYSYSSLPWVENSPKNWLQLILVQPISQGQMVIKVDFDVLIETH